MTDFAERLVDRIARRPHGLLGRLLYRFPVAHKPGFDLVLAKMAPDSGDHVVEIGCGGGVFMRRVLRSGCRATVFDHSDAMVDATKKLNARAVRSGHLKVLQADVAALPMADAVADKIYCLNAFFFFPDPENALQEMARVLKPGGTLALVTSPPEMQNQIGKYFGRMAQRMRFDEPDDLGKWSRAAGLEVKDVLKAPKAGVLLLAAKNGGHDA